MRLTEDQIRQAILHPERTVRDLALRYFSEARCDDPTIMPVAIQAMEKYGRKGAFSFNHHLNDLPQTEPTVEWVIAELKGDFQGTPLERYFYFQDLSRLVNHADSALVALHADEILQAPNFDARERPGLQERLELRSWDAERCWRELHRHCEAEKDKEGIEEFDFAHGSRVIEALARLDHPYEQDMLSLLAQPVTDYRRNPMKWLQPMLAKLAGAIRLSLAIPLLVANLGHQHYFLSDQSMFALAQIGTEEIVQAVCGPFPKSGRDYRLYASDLLGKLRSDTVIPSVLEFLHHEQDLRTQIHLCEALLGNFSIEGIEPSRQLLRKHALTPDLRDLRRELIAVSTTLGVRFPEYEDWMREAQKDAQESDLKTAELREIMYESKGDLGVLLEMMKAKFGAVQPPLPLPPSPSSLRGPLVDPWSRPPVRPQKLGRNDPCPCGSGKKYKNCCMRRG